MPGMRGIDSSVNEKERKERGLSALRRSQAIYIRFQCSGPQLEDPIPSTIGIDPVSVVFIVLFADSSTSFSSYMCHGHYYSLLLVSYADMKVASAFDSAFIGQPVVGVLRQAYKNTSSLWV